MMTIITAGVDGMVVTAAEAPTAMKYVMTAFAWTHRTSLKDVAAVVSIWTGMVMGFVTTITIFAAAIGTEEIAVVVPTATSSVLHASVWIQHSQMARA